MIEILYFVPILLSAFAIGNFMFKFFKLKITYLEESIFSVVLGFAFYSYFTLFLGLIGWLHAWVYWIVILSSLVLWRKTSLNFIKSIFDQIKNFKIKPNLETFLVAVIAAFVILAILSTLVPPFLWDEMDYRLAHPKIWARHHGLTPIYSRWFSEFPSNIDILFVVGILLKNGILAKFFSLSYGLLLALAIYSFGKRFYGRKTGLIAAAIYLSLPMVMNHIGAAYIDISVASIVFLSLYCFMMWANAKSDGWLYLSAILTGLSLASKYTAVVPALLLGIFVLYFAYRDGGISNSIKKALIFSLIAILLVAPWLIKTYIRTSNPVLPFFYEFFGGKYWSTGINEYFFQKLDGNPFRNFLDILLYPWNITMHSSSFSLLLGWNVVFLAFVPLLVFYKKIDRVTKYLLLYSIAFLIIAIPSAFIFFGLMRYLLVYSTLALISAVVINELIRRKIIGKVIFGILSLTFIFTAMLWVGIFGQKVNHVFGIENESEYYNKLLDDYGYNVFHYINKNLPQNSLVLFFRDTRGYLSDRDYIVALPSEQSILDYNKGDNEFYQQLKELDVTHVIVNTNIDFYKPQDTVKNRRRPISKDNQEMMDKLLKKNSVLLFESKGVYLYQLK